MTQTEDLSPCHRALLQLCGSVPVGMAFVDEPPPGVPPVARAAVSGCTYWRQAQDGAPFYTEAADHFGCPVGAHTHGVPLPPKEKEELSGLIATMVGLAYLSPDEVAQIPQRQEAMRYAVYGPLEQMPCPPDLVIVRGSARQLMLLGEATRAAGCGDAVPIMGRPTCAMVPQVVGSFRAATSLGCIGNRVYTDLADGEGYVAIPASALPSLFDKLQAITRANEALLEFHQQRRSANEASRGA